MHFNINVSTTYLGFFFLCFILFFFYFDLLKPYFPVLLITFIVFV